MSDQRHSRERSRQPRLSEIPFSLSWPAKRKGQADAPGPNDLNLRQCCSTVLPFLYADGLDLLFSVRLGFECGRSNLYPGGFGRPSFNDLAFLRRFLLDDVVVGTGRGHQKAHSCHCQR
jgi:hypothetical protein